MVALNLRRDLFSARFLNERPWWRIFTLCHQQKLTGATFLLLLCSIAFQAIWHFINQGKSDEIRVIFDVVSIGQWSLSNCFKVTKTQRKKIFLRRNSFDVVALPVLKNCYGLIKRNVLKVWFSNNADDAKGMKYFELLDEDMLDYSKPLYQLSRK